MNWFQDRQSRNALIRSFNLASREAFVSGEVPVVMEASISRGDPAYCHQFSNRIGGSGFRIKVLSGKQLSKEELVSVGNTVLVDDILVRKMVVLGWDTLEIYCDSGNFGCKWQLRDYLVLGQ